MKVITIVCCLGASLLITEVALAQKVSSQEPSQTVALNQLLNEQWQYTLRHDPEMATTLGDLRYNTQWRDRSWANVQQELKDKKAFLKRFEAIDGSHFSEEDKLNQQLMIRQLNEDIQWIELKLYEMPFDQMEGVHLQLPGMISSIPFDNTQEYEQYLSRLKAIPTVLAQATEVAQKGLKDGMMPPKYILEKVVEQIDNIAKQSGEANVFAQPLKHFPTSVSATDQKRLHDQIIDVIDHKVRPAYQQLGQFIAKDYAPHGRSQPGYWQLPNGDALYRFQVAHNTTTKQTPEQIYQLGLSEVKRIEAEIAEIAKSQGYPDLASFKAALKLDPKLFPTSREDILNRYRGFIAGMQPELPKLFGLLPKTNVEVVPVEAYREKEAAGAEYHQGTPDGSRPGQVFVNTGDYAHRATPSIESTAYHEAIPGHHMQIAIAQALTDLPPFRQQSFYTAYVEGWALYSEHLGKDIGFYKDPISDYGRLSAELLRADRLVLDTGVHYKHWSRQQMVDFFHAHSSEDEPNIQAETDRYVSWPGQALAYKIGQLKILSLREKAKKELGAAFDIRAFHDQILNGGALPLDVLEAKINRWIADAKAKQSS